MFSSILANLASQHQTAAQLSFFTNFSTRLCGQISKSLFLD